MSQLAAQVLQNHLNNGMPLEEALEIWLIKNNLGSKEVQEVINSIPKPTEPPQVIRIRQRKSKHINLRISETLYNKLLEFGSISKTVRAILIEKFKAGDLNVK